MGRLVLPSAQAVVSSSAYRADIDGLRAIAVIAVLLFHCFPSVVSGGFVGVDVFFVISGYLIGRVSFKELISERYSAWAYFGRRARRIFPALIVMLVSVLMAGWYLLFPSEYQLLGKHVAGASVFISNWQFWREAGYFNTEATLKPLLHLWSLAVEEQFYLLLPLILMVGIRRRQMYPWVLGGVALLSFLCVTLRLADHKVWSYFNLVARCWELLMGVMLAYCQSELRQNPLPANIPEPWASIISLAGLLLILGSAWCFSEDTLFPGPNALMPTLGAAFLIAAGSRTRVNGLLAWRPLVYIGLISYPLYLWHWPLLAMLRLIDAGQVDSQSRLAVFIISFPLAAATYHLIERPLRFSEFSLQRYVPQFLWGCLLALGAAGLYIFLGAGLNDRRLDWDSNLRPASGNQILPPKDFSSLNKAILLGDSNALMYSNALRSYFYHRHGQELIFGFREGCKPFYNLDKHNPGDTQQGCPKFVNPAIERAVNDPSINTIVFVTALNYLNYYVYPGYPDASPDIEVNHDLMSRAANDTFSLLTSTGKRVIMFFTTPVLMSPIVECQRRPIRWRSHEKTDCSITDRDYQAQQSWSRNKLDEWSAHYPNLYLFDPAKALCKDGKCSARIDGKLIYADAAHLNAYGAELVSRMFDF